MVEWGGHHGDWGGFGPPSYIVKKCPGLEPKMVTISAHNTNIYKIFKLCKAIFSKLCNISQPNFTIILISLCSF
jgi:hypothetical protein